MRSRSPSPTSKSSSAPSSKQLHMSTARKAAKQPEHGNWTSGPSTYWMTRRRVVLCEKLGTTPRRGTSCRRSGDCRPQTQSIVLFFARAHLSIGTHRGRHLQSHHGVIHIRPIPAVLSFASRTRHPRKYKENGIVAFCRLSFALQTRPDHGIFLAISVRSISLRSGRPYRTGQDHLEPYTADLPIHTDLTLSAAPAIYRPKHQLTKENLRTFHRPKSKI